MTVDIGSLDDDQLREMMVKNGLEVGPIVASTRKFYEKKLGLVLSGTPSNGHAKEYSDTEPEEDEEEEQPAVQVVVKASPKKRSSRFVPAPSHILPALPQVLQVPAVQPPLRLRHEAAPGAG